MTQQKEKKRNLPMRMFCALFCLVMITFYMIGGLYAKYSVAQSSGGEARVIKFGRLFLTESGDFGADGTLRIIPGVNLTKKAVVSFEGSEASTYIFVKVTPSSDFTTTDNKSFAVWRDGQRKMQWEIADEWVFLETDKDGGWVYYRTLAPNTPLEADILADSGRITVSDSITKAEISTMNTISIGIRAFAVQNAGFADPAAAWESLGSKGE